MDSRAFLTTDKRVTEVDELLAVLVRGVRTSLEHDLGSPRYFVEKFEPRGKPATAWRLDEICFQIVMTYCISMRLPPSAGADQPEKRNDVFVYLVGVPPASHSVCCVCPSTDGGDWRRGYCGDKRWDLKKPQRGFRNRMYIRFDAQVGFDIEERTTLALVRGQAL